MAEAGASAAASASTSTSNITPPLTSNTISLSRSGFIKSSGCTSFLPPVTDKTRPRPALTRCPPLEGGRSGVPAQEALEWPQTTLSGQILDRQIVARFDVVWSFKTSLECRIHFQITVQNGSLWKLLPQELWRSMKV